LENKPAAGTREYGSAAVADLEAALVTTIQPGQYTAEVRGKNNASGIGVVQIYFLQ
jgi:hypothetical protein